MKYLTTFVALVLLTSSQAIAAKHCARVQSTAAGSYNWEQTPCPRLK